MGDAYCLSYPYTDLHALALRLHNCPGSNFFYCCYHIRWSRKDPGVIVIDEVIGMLIALIGAPAIPVVWFIAFLLFRFFDIVKPFPVSWPDKHLNGGLGIVLDDILAGLYTLLVLQAGYMLIGI